jgi:hypothetical protein
VGEVHFVPLSENRAGVIREELYHNYKEK